MIIGIDFGTTNVRIATWEPEVGGLPDLRLPGKGGMTIMPSVIAYRRKSGGGVEIEAIGEDADVIPDQPDSSTVKVIRNIKRWALSSDSYFRRALEFNPDTPWPSYLNVEDRCVNLWDERVDIFDIVQAIIKEALKRVGLGNVTDGLRAACPVQSDYIYRKDLVDVFSRLNYQSKVTWVTEEPLLLLAIARSLDLLDAGSYLVYDFGGGSFDCALATLEGSADAMNLNVFAAGGNPLLGGTDIDDMLKSRLKYEGARASLRIAKQEICDNPSKNIVIPGGFELSYSDIEAVLNEGKFFNRTLDVMLDVYRRAKLIWKRDPDGPPIGENLSIDSNGRITKRVSALREDDMAKDIDKVLLLGGTTKIPYIAQRLESIFGPDKVVRASQLLSGFQDPELTAVALGAAYPPKEQYVPFFIDRLPSRITLSVQHSSEIQHVEYIPYDHLRLSKPLAPYVSQVITFPGDGAAEYRATIEDADGEILHNSDWQPTRSSFGPAKKLRIVIDHFGRLFLEMITGLDSNPFTDRIPLIQIPPWQIDAQRSALERIWEEQRKYEEVEHSRFLRYLFTNNPFGWGTDVG